MVHEMKPMRAYVLSVLLVVLFTSAVFGDGCYIPERAIRRIPEIPAQRAVVAWKDGVETLVISSSLDSESQKLGWLIPLPSVPRTMEKESPGALKTLNFCIQPKITHDLWLEIKGVLFIVLVGNLLLGTMIFRRNHFPALLLLLLMLSCLWSLMLPAIGAVNLTSVKAANVSVEKSAKVGSYDINVLKPAKQGDLNAWLDENDFSTLPTTADKIIDEYIAQGWVFVAIKLSRDEAGRNTPHPIKLVFDAKQAVYPMRLTSLAGGSPVFEIFVIANDSVSCDMLNEEFCDRFTKATHHDSFNGMTSQCKIGHSAICSLMWNDCVLTKFSGTIRAANMTRDMLFPWKTFKAYRQHFYTATGAGELALIFFLALSGMWIFYSMARYWKKIAQPHGTRWYFTKELAPAIALFALGMGILYTSLPKLDASVVNVSRGRSLRIYPRLLQDSIKEILLEHPDVCQGTSQEIADSLLNHLGKSTPFRDAVRNNITGSELKVEDSPGNFTVERDQDHLVIRVYDQSGMALINRFPEEESTATRSKP